MKFNNNQLSWNNELDNKDIQPLNPENERFVEPLSRGMDKGMSDDELNIYRKNFDINDQDMLYKVQYTQDSLNAQIDEMNESYIQKFAQITQDEDAARGYNSLIQLQKGYNIDSFSFEKLKELGKIYKDIDTDLANWNTDNNGMKYGVAQGKSQLYDGYDVSLMFQHIIDRQSERKLTPQNSQNVLNQLNAKFQGDIDFKLSDDNQQILFYDTVSRDYRPIGTDIITWLDANQSTAVVGAVVELGVAGAAILASTVTGGGSAATYAASRAPQAIRFLNWLNSSTKVSSNATRINRVAKGITDQAMKGTLASVPGLAAITYNDPDAHLPEGIAQKYNLTPVATEYSLSARTKHFTQDLTIAAGFTGALGAAMPKVAHHNFTTGLGGKMSLAAHNALNNAKNNKIVSEQSQRMRSGAKGFLDRMAKPFDSLAQEKLALDSQTILNKQDLALDVTEAAKVQSELMASFGLEVDNPIVAQALANTMSKHSTSQAKTILDYASKMPEPDVINMNKFAADFYTELSKSFKQYADYTANINLDHEKLISHFVNNRETMIGLLRSHIDIAKKAGDNKLAIDEKLVKDFAEVIMKGSTARTTLYGNDISVANINFNDDIPDYLKTILNTYNAKKPKKTLKPQSPIELINNFTADPDGPQQLSNTFELTTRDLIEMYAIMKLNETGVRNKGKIRTLDTLRETILNNTDTQGFRNVSTFLDTLEDNIKTYKKYENLFSNNGMKQYIKDGSDTALRNVVKDYVAQLNRQQLPSYDEFVNYLGIDKKTADDLFATTFIDDMYKRNTSLLDFSSISNKILTYNFTSPKAKFIQELFKNVNDSFGNIKNLSKLEYKGPAKTQAGGVSSNLLNRFAVMHATFVQKTLLPMLGRIIKTHGALDRAAADALIQYAKKPLNLDINKMLVGQIRRQVQQGKLTPEEGDMILKDMNVSQDKIVQINQYFDDLYKNMQSQIDVDSTFLTRLTEMANKILFKDEVQK